MAKQKHMPKPNAVSDYRILICHIAIIAAAVFLDASMGLRVPGAEHVISARAVSSHPADPREPRTRRTDATAYRSPDNPTATPATHP